MDSLSSSAIAANKLVKYYWEKKGFLKPTIKKVEALRGVSFRVEWGIIYGLLGPNGAGKTTTVKILATLLEPDSGEAFVAGYSTTREPLEVRKRIGVMLSVERGFFWRLTGRENLKYFGMLYGLSSRVLEERVEELIELLGLRELGADKKKFEDMSLGMKARLGLARVLLKDPPVLLLDEPTLGLDPPSARYIRRLLRELVSQGKTILVTTHNMFEAETLCDRVGIIHRGEIIAEGSPRELKKRVAKKLSILLRLVGSYRVTEELSRWVSSRNSVSSRVVERDRAIELRVVADRAESEQLLAVLVKAAVDRGLKVIESRVEEPTLEDVFIELTGGGSVSKEYSES